MMIMKKHFLLVALFLMGTASIGAYAQEARKHVQPELPYKMNALAPLGMSEETLEYHYGKHYKAYIDNLNALIPGTPYAQMPLEVVVTKAPDGPIFNNAAQALNHELFFYELSPTPQAKPMGTLAVAIDRDFGSFEEFKADFAKKAAGLFGSGWAWLATDKDGNLSITTDANAGTPWRYGLTPLMGLDVWEHSYYIDYRNRRADYITNFWGMVDWRVVEERYELR